VQLARKLRFAVGIHQGSQSHRTLTDLAALWKGANEHESIGTCAWGFETFMFGACRAAHDYAAEFASAGRWPDDTMQRSTNTSFPNLQHGLRFVSTTAG
jgi:hypothetical protein